MTNAVFDEHGNLTPEEEARRSVMQSQMLAQAGEATEDYVEVDFFGCDTRQQVYLPGSNTQFVVIKELTEGDRKKYLDKTNREVKFAKDQTATMRSQPGTERHALLKEAIVGWNFLRDGSVMNEMTHPRLLDEFLDKTSPKVIDHILKAVHKLNPWLLADMSIEDIDEELKNLTEMRELKVKEEAKNGSSASR